MVLLDFLKIDMVIRLQYIALGNLVKKYAGGPHVNNTKGMGRFKILKEESSSKGVRRIKAVLIEE